MSVLSTELQKRIKKTVKYDTYFWRVMAVGLWVTAGAAVIVTGLGNPTGLGLLSDLFIYSALHVIAFFLLTKIGVLLLSLTGLPVPRLFVSSLLYTGLTAFFILYNAKLGTLFSSLIGAAYSLAGILLGLLLYLYTSKGIHCKYKTLFVLLLISCIIIMQISSPVIVQPVLSDDVGSTIPLRLDNPAKPGLFNYRYFTYGSGKDNHRKEFSAGAELLSTPVDASAYIEEWDWTRKLFWGFDEKNLPLNGRVWLPKGKGPFPLVLMVHGNHRMEYFSDAGYGYLGELLTSRGFIAVSVDQNFLNYSSWSTTPKQDMKLRAWLLIHHLLQIEKYRNMPETPFYQQVDMQKIALVGHSRGGQAAAMAADYTTWFSLDSSISGINNIGIQAVVGLAPTDKRVDGKSAYLTDTYYLVLHGARDADISSFLGDRQYVRSSYRKGSERFKASLYIGEANHSQFNTDWGRMDSSLPQGLFLSQSETMAPFSQREVAKVMISAFLEIALHGKHQYSQLFRDYRSGGDWLPEAQYINRFENGLFQTLTDFKRSTDKKMLDNGVTVAAEGFIEWEVKEAQDRQRRKKGVYGVVLAWNEEGAYTLSIPGNLHNSMPQGRPDKLVISMANMERDLRFKSDGESATPNVDVEIQTTVNDSVRIPLDRFMPFPPQIYTQYTKSIWLDKIMKNGKYKEAAEPVFQTFAIPLVALKQFRPGLRPGSITKITLHFNGGPGKVMIDEIGFEYSPPQKLQ